MNPDQAAREIKEAASRAEEDLRDFVHLLDFFCEGVDTVVADLEEDLKAQVSLLDSREMEDIWLELSDARNTEMVTRMKAAYLVGYARGAGLLEAMRPSDDDEKK
ncbi:MAG: hypothetical protein IT210_01020 [Armatimonadetes bacterium]|nr:hypothetical protein [Armatimonadota bacterium]